MKTEEIMQLINDILNRNINNKLTLELCMGISLQVKTVVEQHEIKDGTE